MSRPRGCQPDPDDGGRMTPEVEDRIWAEVQRRIDMGPAGRPGLPPTPDRRPLVALMAVAACALLVGLLVAQRPQADEGELATATTVDPHARVTLAELAEAARDQPGTRVDEGQVLYVWTDLVRAPGQSPDDAKEARQVQRITGDGRGRVDVLRLSDDPDTQSPDATEHDTPRRLLIGPFTPDEVAALPPGTEALRAAFREAAGEGATDLDVADYVLTVLATPLPRGTTRAAMYEFLDTLSVDVLGSSRGRNGVSGVVLVTSEDERRREAVVDPDTAQVLSITRSGTGTSRGDPAITVYREIDVQPG